MINELLNYFYIFLKHILSRTINLIITADKYALIRPIQLLIDKLDAKILSSKPFRKRRFAILAQKCGNGQIYTVMHGLTDKDFCRMKKAGKDIFRVKEV